MPQIKITAELKEILDRLKHPGQTYDGAIRDLAIKAGAIKTEKKS